MSQKYAMQFGKYYTVLIELKRTFDILSSRDIVEPLYYKILYINKI